MLGVCWVGVAQAGIRTYEQSASSSHSSQEGMVEPDVTAAVPSQEEKEFGKKVTELWNKAIVQEIQKENASKDLVVYITVSDASDNILEQLEKLRESDIVKNVGLSPYIIMEKVEPATLERVLSKVQNLERLRDVDVHTDTFGDWLTAYGITRSTVIYTDPTGAVRLYSLAYEVDKLERQLKRQYAIDGGAL